MAEVCNIIIYREGGELIVKILPIDNEKNSTATILNYSGEVIKKIGLKCGTNNIDLSPYTSKNYSVRVTNGKNVVVQKI